MKDRRIEVLVAVGFPDTWTDQMIQGWLNRETEKGGARHTLGSVVRDWARDVRNIEGLAAMPWVSDVPEGSMTRINLISQRAKDFTKRVK